MSVGTTVLPEAVPATRVRVADYWVLTKPRLGLMVLFTVAAGFLLANRTGPNLWGLLHTLFGTALVVAGASAFNQLLERNTDAQMQRTQNRPLPAGRLQPRETLVFSLALGVGGILYLALVLPQLLAAVVAGCAFLGYVFCYTPLKRKTTLNTLVGAVPGALPPVIGCTAATGSISSEAVVLFLILFLWQIPHFLAIAWIYRDDYARAGMRMLPVVDREGGRTAVLMVSYCLALVPASLTPCLLGLGDHFYLAGAMLFGLAFLAQALRFARERSETMARRVLQASLVYLPALLGLLLLNSPWSVVGSP